MYTIKKGYLSQVHTGAVNILADRSRKITDEKENQNVYNKNG